MLLNINISYFKVILVSFVFAIFITGCALKQGADNIKAQEQSSKSLQIFIKSPLIRINDAGFVHANKKGILVQVYSLAHPILQLALAQKICVNKACRARADFNKRFFGREYYNSLLDDIVLSKPIFNAKNLKANDCGGFSQKIEQISYEVCANKSTFSLANSVKISLTKIE